MIVYREENKIDKIDILSMKRMEKISQKTILTLTILLLKKLEFHCLKISTPNNLISIWVL